jgi:hypothetical protein
MHALLLLGGLLLTADKEPEPQTKTDFAAFQKYLETNKIERWKGDPRPLASDALKTAYPNRRFYYTFEMPPLPPGAALPELIERHRRASEEYQKTRSLRLVIAFDADGKITRYQNGSDFNTGLMAVKSDDDARTAAAAVLAIASCTQVGPGPVDPKEVTVRKDDQGWTCTISKKMAFDGEVKFDAEGKVTAASKRMNFIMPLPPSAPPRPIVPPPGTDR